MIVQLEFIQVYRAAKVTMFQFSSLCWPELKKGNCTQSIASGEWKGLRARQELVTEANYVRAFC